MIEYDLAGAHPAYRREIPEILEPLAEAYPGAGFRSVGLYEPKPGDTSMGATHPGGRIELNPHWFARDPVHLKSAAQHYPVIDVGGIQIGWHGPMVWEPLQVLTHEFGHVVRMALPKRLGDEWAGDRWRQATREPWRAPSGYALVNDEEFFGEMFALVHLGFATDDEARDMAELTERLR